MHWRGAGNKRHLGCQSASTENLDSLKQRNHPVVEFWGLWVAVRVLLPAEPRPAGN